MRTTIASVETKSIGQKSVHAFYQSVFASRHQENLFTTSTGHPQSDVLLVLGQNCVHFCLSQVIWKAKFKTSKSVLFSGILHLASEGLRFLKLQKLVQRDKKEFLFQQAPPVCIFSCKDWWKFPLEENLRCSGVWVAAVLTCGVGQWSALVPGSGSRTMTASARSPAVILDLTKWSLKRFSNALWLPSVLGCYSAFEK